MKMSQPAVDDRNLHLTQLPLRLASTDHAAQFTLERFDFNSNYALKANSDKYLSRVAGGIPGVKE